MKRHYGFTLIEMMAVIIIIGILAAVIGSNIIKPVDTSRRTAAIQSLKQLESAITMYKLDTSKYPESLRDLVREPEGANNWNGPYLKETAEPKDPWGNRYEYKIPGADGQPFDLISFAADGHQVT